MDSTDAQPLNPIERYQAYLPPEFSPLPRRLELNTQPPPVGPGVVFRAVRRWWWQFVLVWAAGTAAVCAFVQTTVKPTYEANSLLRIEPNLLDLFGQVSSSNSSFQDYLETQVELISSANMLQTASTEPQVAALPEVRTAGDPEVVLRRMLRVNIVPKSYLIRVAAVNQSPAGAADVVNAVVNAYLKADAEWSEGTSRHLIKSLDNYHKELKTQIEEKQKAWLELAAKGNADSTAAPDRPEPGAPAGVRLTIEEYQRVREQLFQTDLELGEAEARLDSLREARQADDGLADARRVEHFIARDPEVIDLAEQIHQLETQGAMAGQRARSPADPSVKEVRFKVEHLRGRLARLRDQRRTEAASDAGPAEPDTAQHALAEAELNVATLRATKAKIESVLGRMEISNREQSTDAVKIALVQADLKHLEEMQGAVNRRLEQFRFESRGQARVRRINEAKVPSRAFADRRPMLLGFLPLAAFALLLSAVTLLEVKAGRVHRAEDLSRRVPVEVFTVPPLPVATPVRGKCFAEQLEEYAHRIDHLREAVCGPPSVSRRGRCLVITSAIGGEGKTVLSKNLALRCASGGASTLIIDADLRRASLGILLQVPDSPGLSDVLQGKATLAEALVRIDPVNRCYFLPAGTPETNPGKVLQSHRYGPTLERLRAHFDVVIVDTPPLLPVPDALTLARRADGVVIATRHDLSRLSQVEKISRMLATARVPILGMVVNGLRPEGAAAGSYDYGYRMSRDITVHPVA